MRSINYPKKRVNEIETKGNDFVAHDAFMVVSDFLSLINKARQEGFDIHEFQKIPPSFILTEIEKTREGLLPSSSHFSSMKNIFKDKRITLEQINKIRLAYGFLSIDKKDLD